MTTSARSRVRLSDVAGEEAADSVAGTSDMGYLGGAE